MKKFTRIVFSSAILAALTISQVPSDGKCQMTAGGFLAAGCPMPCCKTKLPMPKCPMLKAAAARDLIAASGITTLRQTLQPLHHASLIRELNFRLLISWATDLTGILHVFFAGPPQMVRAPPSDSHPLDA